MKCIKYSILKKLFTIFDLSKIDIETSNNRWVTLSKIIPWEKSEERYAKHLNKKVEDLELL